MNFKINLLICLSVLLTIGGVTRSEDEQVDFEDMDGSVGAESQPNVDVKSEEKKEKSFYKNNLKVKYVKPVPKGVYHFLETFDIDTIGTKWIKSKAKKDDVDESIAKYEGEWSIESSGDSVFEGDKGLVLKSKAKHHAISSKLIKPFLFSNKNPLIVQYEVKFQSPLECGGAYVKLLSDEPKLSLENFYDKTSFSIMFGPDKCGGESKYHFIVRFKHPVKGTFEEKHAKKSELIDAYFNDGKTHLYTLIVEPDNTFKMLIDMNEVNSGSLLKDLNPPINPQKEIIDPNDKKPESWDEREKIPDPDAVKPEDWDENEPKEIPDENAKMPEGWLETEPETISDASAVKPDDWDDTTDGEWEAPKVDNPKCKNAPGCGKWTAPMISNPRYKGKWRAPLIDNTNYQGKWEPRKIPNPDFFEDNEPFYSFVPFSAIGLELWSMTDNIYFDNFLITDDKSVADQFAKDSWVLKKSLESINSRSSDSVIDGLLNAANEKPWLWALYILVILLPIIIIAVFCCGKSPSKSSGKADAGKAKKTDAPSQDDATEEPEVNDDEDEEQLINDAEEPKEEETKASLEPTEEDVSNDAKVDEGKKAKSSPVKRRSARKD